MGEPITSATQQQWQDIAAAVRAQIAKAAARMPEMGPDDLKTFVEAVALAREGEIDAAAYDETLASVRRRLDRETAFGG